jgi:hypothetical protein
MKVSNFFTIYVSEILNRGVPRGGVSLKFRSFDKAEPNSQLLGKYIRHNPIRIRVSSICKLSGTLA